jgi:hypothetical protein
VHLPATRAWRGAERSGCRRPRWVTPTAGRRRVQHDAPP